MTNSTTIGPNLDDDAGKVAEQQPTPSSTCLKIPKNSAEFSTNWKQLLAKSVIKHENRSISESKNRRPQISSEQRQKNHAAAVPSVSSTTFDGFQRDFHKFSKTGQKSDNKNAKAEEVKKNLGKNFDKFEKKSEIFGSKRPPMTPETRDSLQRDEIKLHKADKLLTKCLALDCEFVGVGENGTDDMLARVSLVDLHGNCVYDKYVTPVEQIVNYRTPVSGIRPEHLVNAEPLKFVQKEVGDLLKGRILVGHGVKKDLTVLFLSHPKRDIRDTSKYKPFRGIAKTKFPSLKKLASLILGISIQTGEHDSVTDARVTMQLYRTERKIWEKKESFGKKKKEHSTVRKK